MVEVKVAAADRAARDLDDCVARVFDLGIANRIVADVFLAVPNQGFHLGASSAAFVGSSGQCSERDLVHLLSRL